MAYLFPWQGVTFCALRDVWLDGGRDWPLRNSKIPLRFLNLPPSKAVTRIRIRDSLTIRYDAGKSSRPAEPSTAEIAFVDVEPLLPIGTRIEKRRVGEEEGESNGGEAESSLRAASGEEPGDRGRGDKRSGDKRSWDKRSGKRAGKTSKGGESCEEEEAVAIIARVQRENFGPQIVRQEEDGGGSSVDEAEIEEEVERVKGDESVVGRGMEKGEGEEEKAEEEELSEEDSPDITALPTLATPLKGTRATTPSSLLSLYRFFSSHLGISSPSTVASLLASHLALLRSDPTSDLLPCV
ncbi:unnamed protein product [Closterium sp. NIES-54]